MSVNNTPEEKRVEGIMVDLVRQLAQLAPHPARPDYKGPLFVSIDPSIKPAAEYDGMLGGVLIESMLGTAFSAAVSGSFGDAAGSVDWSNAAEASSQWLQERAPANTNFQLGSRNAIRGAFNQANLRAEMMDAFTRDLPRRLGIERWLAEYQRKLYSLHKQARARAFALAAA